MWVRGRAQSTLTGQLSWKGLGKVRFMGPCPQVRYPPRSHPDARRAGKEVLLRDQEEKTMDL